MATVRRAGPPVPPRPHAILLKTRNVDIGRASPSLSNRSSIALKSTVISTSASAMTSPSSSKTSTTKPEDGRTVVYKSPSFNIQKRQEQREKRYSFNTADSTCGNSTSTILIERTHAPLPPPQVHAKPMVASKKPPPKPTAPVPINIKADNNLSNNNTSSLSSTSLSIDNQNHHRTEVVNNNNNNNNNTSPVLVNPTPQPKPRTLISKAPGGFLRRSKTTLDNFTRSTITIATISNGDTNNNNNNNNDMDNFNGNTHPRNTNTITGSGSGNNGGGGGSGGFMSGRTFDIKNNLKNAAERLFSEIVSHSKDSKNQNKTSNSPPTPLNRSESLKTATDADANVDSQLDQNGNNNSQITVSPFKPKLEDPITPEKKIVFHEMLISELAAMRQRSSSVDQLNTRSDFSFRVEIDVDEDFKNGNGFQRQRRREEKEEDEDENKLDDDKMYEAKSEKSVDEKSMDDSGTGSALTLPLHGNMNKTKRPRQRCPSGCSTDSSPCGPESVRIRTSDWIEVGENGKEEVMTSCHISLEDSGMEDEERPDDGSSGVGDSWDSVQEAKKEEEERQMRIKARRQMSMADLPPLPKSLSTHLTFNEPNLADSENANESNNGTPVVIATSLDKQLSVLRKEMYGLRQLDISLLSQLWTLNDSIQNFRTMLDEDEECYSPSPAHSPYPSPYDSVSSDAEDDLSPSIQTQIQQYPSEQNILTQAAKQTTSPSLHSSHASLTITTTSTTKAPTPHHKQQQSPEIRVAMPTAITTQPTSRISIPAPTPTPRSPIKTSPPTVVSTMRQINSKYLPPPPAPPATKPPVERLSLRPSQSFPSGTINGGKSAATSPTSSTTTPVPVQRMRIAPPPPPVQRRVLVSPGRPS